MTMQESEPAALRPEMRAEVLPPLQAVPEQANQRQTVPLQTGQPQTVAVQTVPFTEKSLLYSCASTYAEYVASSSRQDFLEMRDREIRLLPEDQAYFTAYPDFTHWLIVAADDSPDTLVVLPLLAHMAAWAPRLVLRVVGEDDAASLLPALIDDAKLLASLAEADLPLLISFDDAWQFQEQWGPHPQAIEPLLEQWLNAHEDFEQLAEDESVTGQAAYTRLLDQLLLEMRLWYNSGLNHACGEELTALLARWRDESDDDEGDDEP